MNFLKKLWNRPKPTPPRLSIPRDNFQEFLDTFGLSQSGEKWVDMRKILIGLHKRIEKLENDK